MSASASHVTPHQPQQPRCLHFPPNIDVSNRLLLWHGSWHHNNMQPT